ncbi:MAG: hypothetical protein ACK2UB_13835 [Anaerolineales bacterium]|jgi:hypothetical protein
MSRPTRQKRFLIVLLASILAAIACGPVGTPTGHPAVETPTLPQTTNTPTEPPVTGTEIPLPSLTFTPVPPTATPSPEPETATPTLTAWLFVNGTWSGCVDAPTPLVPYTAYPCTVPSGNFVTLYLKAHCVIGEYCGNYVKGRFESEFILLKLTLLGIQGQTVWMHGEAGSGMFSWATTDVTIERVGNMVKIAEQAAQQYIHVLPKGCDPVIQSGCGAGCFEYLS